MTIFFTGDFHVNHYTLMKIRGFNTLEEMNNTLIDNYNKRVTNKDTVYMLGDMVWKIKDCEDTFKKLNGKKYVYLGNHDDTQKYKKLLIDKIISGLEIVGGITIDKNYIWLSHYCHRVWNRSCHNSFHLFAHSHGTLQTVNRSMDVGVDNCLFLPIPWEEVYDKLKDRTNVNFS